ncbi:Protein of unknown function [Propionibacterium freudenreichii]|nr:Protein of unknown function [Propionibacterium freudenreichii]
MRDADLKSFALA